MLLPQGMLSPPSSPVHHGHMSPQRCPTSPQGVAMSPMFSPAQSEAGLRRPSQPLMMPQPANLPNLPNLHESLMQPMMPSADLSVAFKRKHGLKKGSGWRTPSPFGSPPLSSAPTAASSPRTAEAASTTGSGVFSEAMPW